MRSNAKRLMLVVVLTTLMSMTTGCGAADDRNVRPTVDADAVRVMLRESCKPVVGNEGLWECEASALAQVEHSLVDLKWNLIECDEEKEYLGKKCLIQVEFLEGELASCEHDPWCLGPIVGAIMAILGCLLGAAAF